LTGEILYADTFGNLLTSLGRFDRLSTETLRFSPWIHGLQGFDIQNRRLQLKLMDGSLLPLVKTFGEIPPGGCAAVVGSTGLLEIAANRSSAADLLKLHDGDLIQLLF
jgi:S-adenosylmethionine hydrolase